MYKFCWSYLGIYKEIRKRHRAVSNRFCLYKCRHFHSIGIEFLQRTICSVQLTSVKSYIILIWKLQTFDVCSAFILRRLETYVQGVCWDRKLFRANLYCRIRDIRLDEIIRIRNKATNIILVKISLPPSSSYLAKGFQKITFINQSFMLVSRLVSNISTLL